MTRLQLIALVGDRVFDLPPECRFVLGRALGNDLPVLDPTISRRHAEVWREGEVVQVRDLGSSNGTFVNGRRVESGTVAPDEEVTFGKVTFVLRASEAIVPEADTSSVKQDGGAAPHPSATILRARPVGFLEPRVRPLRDTGSGTAGAGGSAPAVRAGSAPPPDQAGASLSPATTGEPTGATPAARPVTGRVERRLELLLAVSHALGRARDTDALLRDVVEMVFEIMEADRAAVLLLDDAGALVPVVARDASGAPLTESVPRSIADRAVTERIAILSDDAPQDQRFTGESIVAQHVRSAICAPLLGSDGAPLGVLYVDNRTLTHRYTDDDLDFAIAFAGLAGVALENSRFAERLRSEAVVRANFERYFAPALAARIADDPAASRLGGDRRTVAVLFSDIRGFTTLAESMAPDDVAALLTEYFTQMVECVFRHGGTLDKFVGDAVLAQWGAPIGDEGDAQRALDAAMEMQRELAALNARWRALGQPELGIGIGLSFGEVFAGNIGSERRLEYTIIGDTVNVASRLSSIAAAGQILLTGELREALRTPVPLLQEAPLELRGKSRRVDVYRVAS